MANTIPLPWELPWLSILPKLHDKVWALYVSLVVRWVYNHTQHGTKYPHLSG